MLDERNRVNSMQFHMLWKRLSISLAVMLGVVAFTRILPFFFSPIVGLAGSAILYTMLYNNRRSDTPSCQMMVYTIFYCLISYSFFSIIINMLYIWGVISVPGELIFFNSPYIPTLMMMPVSFVTVLIIYLKRHFLSICVDCKLQYGTPDERGVFGRILSHETSVQLRNLLLLFGVLTVITLGYYFFFYIDINQNDRDWFVFVWIVVIAFLIDEVYYAFRYYNLYLDLKESNEIITPDELNDMTAKTYLRLYVICGDRMYLDEHAIDSAMQFKEVYDTPFISRRTINGISMSEIHTVARKITGEEGELRFFFGRRLPDTNRHSVLRYFYILDDAGGCPERLNSDGKWYSFQDVKDMYVKNPTCISTLLLSDLSRLSTIVLTEKTFDEKGNRRSVIKSYTPSFSFDEVRDCNLDFQDDKWIRVSLFNANTRLFRLKKIWRSFIGVNNRY